MTSREDALTALALVITIILLSPVALGAFIYSRFVEPIVVLFE